MNLVTIMNFVRGVEPRNPDLDLVEPVREQIALNRQYGFENTFLLQYDALNNPAFSELFDPAQDKKTELGVWIEIVRPLVEAVGIPWRGRPGYDWDWYVDPGFLPAYTPAERVKLIDELMEKFRAVFGAYPKTAGSWLLDAYSIDYMRKAYQVEAFAICREQLAVDAYTLWGGPYNQPYYPSKNNVLCPAQTEENAIDAPVFRLLGIEPIRGYNEARYAKSPGCGGCATMEPVWRYGSSGRYMEWFFKTYFGNENMGIAYTQIGQENSFGWDKMKNGLHMQYDLVERYAKAGKVQTVTMSEAARLFRKAYPQTPPAALVADTDPVSGGRYRSVWYTCRNYRANLFFDRDFMYFRDIQKFDERYHERYDDEPCRRWDAVYDNLPVVDERGWSEGRDTHEAGLDVEAPFRYRGVQRDGSSLTVFAETPRRRNGEDVRDIRRISVTFDEDGITINGDVSLFWRFGRFTGYSGEPDGVRFVHNGFSYDVGVTGILESIPGGLRVSGSQIRFVLSKRG